MATRTVYGTLSRADGTPWKNARVSFTLTPGTYIEDAGGTQLPGHSVVARADAAGYFEVELQVNSEGAISSEYLVDDPSEDDSYRIVVPAGSGDLSLSQLRTAYVEPSVPVETPFPTTIGGTGLSTYAAGDLPYYAAGTALSRLAIGALDRVLTSSGSAPQWSANIAYAVLPTGTGSWDTGAGTTMTIARSLTVSGTLTGTLSGNASTATALATARSINGVAFDGTADVTVTAAAGTLTGTTLAATVVTSSLTTVGTLTSLALSGAITTTRAASTDLFASTLVTGDSQARFSVDAAGKLSWGPGNGAADWVLERGGVTLLRTIGQIVEHRFATGSASLSPVQLRLRSTTNANDWDTQNPWAYIDFWSDDVTTGGAGPRARISSVMGNTNGRQADLRISVTDVNTTLVEAMRFVSPSSGLVSMVVAAKIITAASVSGNAGSGLRVPHGTAPNSPVDGDVWTTTAGPSWRVNGVTYASVLAASSSITAGSPTTNGYITARVGGVDVKLMTTA